MSDSETVVETPESTHLDDIFGNSINEPITEDPEMESQGLGEQTESEEEVVEESAEEPQETNDELSQLKESIESLKSQYKNAQDLINRQGNELGALRKEAAKPAPTNDEFLDQFADDPTAALQAEMDRREEEKLSKAAEQEAMTNQNRNAILELVPEFDSHIDGIKEWYKGKGASSDFVNSLSTKSLASNVDLAVALGEIQTLNKQLAETKSKNSNVINKLNKGGAVLSGKSGASTSSDSTIQIPSNVTKLSDGQLRAMLKQAQSA
jgi:chromosome segregation ATPase